MTASFNSLPMLSGMRGQKRRAEHWSRMEMTVSTLHTISGILHIVASIKQSRISVVKGQFDENNFFYIN